MSPEDLEAQLQSDERGENEHSFVCFFSSHKYVFLYSTYKNNSATKSVTKTHKSHTLKIQKNLTLAGNGWEQSAGSCLRISDYTWGVMGTAAPICFLETGCKEL